MIEFLLIAVAWTVLAVVVGLAVSAMMRPVLFVEAPEFCVEDGCRLYATHERFEDTVGDTPRTLLVCHRHAGDGRPRW